jgi:predicted dehydrogenase
MGAGPAEDMIFETDDTRQSVSVEGEKSNPACDFVASILDGTLVRASVTDAFQVVALIQAAYRSAREGRIVSL